MSFKLMPHDKYQMENSLEQLLDLVKKVPMIQSCNTCMDFDSGTCRRYAMKPPADFVKDNDCKEYSWDGVPF